MVSLKTTKRQYSEGIIIPATGAVTESKNEELPNVLTNSARSPSQLVSSFQPSRQEFNNSADSSSPVQNAIKIENRPVSTPLPEESSRIVESQFSSNTNSSLSTTDLLQGSTAVTQQPAKSALSMDTAEQKSSATPSRSESPGGTIINIKGGTNNLILGNSTTYNYASTDQVTCSIDTIPASDSMHDQVTTSLTPQEKLILDVTKVSSLTDLDVVVESLDYLNEVISAKRVLLEAEDKVLRSPRA